MRNTGDFIRSRLADLLNEKSDLKGWRQTAVNRKLSCMDDLKHYTEQILDYDARLVILEKEIGFLTELLDKETKGDSAE